MYKIIIQKFPSSGANMFLIQMFKQLLIYGTFWDNFAISFSKRGEKNKTKAISQETFHGSNLHPTICW